MIASAEAYALIKRFEGLRLQSYRDAGGIWTIGWGHTPSSANHVIDEDMASELLSSDVERISQALSGLITCPVLEQHRFDALVSFSYNVGITALAHSELLKYVNLGQFGEASKEFLKWDRAAGEVLPGLRSRRQAEKDLFDGEGSALPAA